MCTKHLKRKYQNIFFRKAVILKNKSNKTERTEAFFKFSLKSVQQFYVNEYCSQTKDTPDQMLSYIKFMFCLLMANYAYSRFNYKHFYFTNKRENKQNVPIYG